MKSAAAILALSLIVGCHRHAPTPPTITSKPRMNQSASERLGRVYTRQQFEAIVGGMRPEQVNKFLGTADSAVPLKGEFQGLIYNRITINPETNEPDKYVMIRFNKETASASKFYYD